MAFSASRLSCELQDCLHLLKYTELFADTCVFSHCKLCLVEKLEKINFLFLKKKTVQNCLLYPAIEAEIQVSKMATWTFQSGL